MAQPETVKLYNTLTRKVDLLNPLVPGRVSLYCCGPTVYGFQHIGNLRAYLFEDILARTLRYAGYQVNHVMNITDVGHLVSDADEGEDKMMVAMRRENKKSTEIAQFYTDQFFTDSAKLHIKKPDVVCKATDHITEIIELIKRIQAAGYAYQSGGNVYFEVEKFKDYGKLAQLKLDTLRAGARIEVDQHKRSPLDFALWFTKSKFENQELQWESPWGRGYPGWHIECSAMSVKYLGEQFDIHCGGIDHIPVHHTNEIAQTESATGKPWVSIWMHGAFLQVDGQKMAKSAGTLYLIDDIINKGFEPLTFRYLCLAAHYSAQINFTWDAVAGAANSLKKLKSIVIGLKSQASPAENLSSNGQKHLTDFKEAIFNNLNMPQALAVMWAVTSDKELPTTEKLALLFQFDQILGFDMSNFKEEAVDISAEVQQLMTERDQARKAKNWKESDRLRDKLIELGYAVEDSAGGTRVKRG